MTLEAKIEAVLFYKSDPVTKKELMGLFDLNSEQLELSLAKIKSAFLDRGITLVATDTEVQLTTAPEVSDTIELIRRDELSADIGKAGAETLAIILYRGPVARADIDRVRGVNSNFILRNLLIRGLIERRTHPTDSRSFLYAVTPLLLNQLGVRSREELPEFGDIMNALDQFEKQEAEGEREKESQNPFVQQT